jgi:hypothetical protein
MTADEWIAVELAKPPAGLADLRVVETAVSVPDGPVLRGLDVEGHRHLLIPVPAHTPVAEDRTSQGVHIEQRDLLDRGQLRRFGDVHCRIPHLNELFAKIADEMLGVLAEHQGDPIRACSVVLDRFRELLRPEAQRLLGRDQLAGVFAELLILKDIVALDSGRRLDCWTGPGGGRHDFRRGRFAVEVKGTLSREGLLVEIHGAEQLEAPDDGDLWLAVVRLENAPGEGRTVSELVREVLDLGVAESELTAKLAMSGYLTADADAYSHIRFDVRQRRVYLVEDGFPRIIPGSFVSGAVPSGVMRLVYVVDLTNEPPTPLEEDEEMGVLSRIAQSDG